MKLRLDRYASNKDSTGGLLFVDGDFFCYTCEDEGRDVKIKGETRIPAGIYAMTIRNEGGMTKRYAARFGSDFHKGMLWIRNIPDFEWVYIHVGNTDDHTDGCPLVGYGANRRAGENTVSRSVEAYKDLYKMILAAIRGGENIEIEIREI